MECGRECGVRRDRRGRSGSGVSRKRRTGVMERSLTGGRGGGGSGDGGSRDEAWSNE